MQPPERFYYNLGEFFSDMEAEDDGEFYFTLGKQMGQFFLGAKSIVESDEIALLMTVEIMSQIASLGQSNEEEDE